MVARIVRKLGALTAWIDVDLAVVALTVTVNPDDRRGIAAVHAAVNRQQDRHEDFVFVRGKLCGEGNLNDLLWMTRAVLTKGARFCGWFEGWW